MITRNVTREQLQQAADKVGVRLYTHALRWDKRDETPLARPCRKSSTGEEFRFQLKTRPRSDGKPASYRRLSQRAHYKSKTGKPWTIPGAVCWHGHRDFFRALYRIAPDAWIKTALAVYTSAKQFEQSFPETANHPSEYMGMRAEFTPYSQACSC
jgi:hypothetical protein